MSDPAITKINGYTPEELTGESLELFYANPNEYGPQGSVRFNPDAFKTSIPYEFYYKRKNRDIFLNESLGTHFTDTDGNIIAYIMVSRDITERKRAEQALQNVPGELDIKAIERIEELERALDLAEETTRLKSRMVATMSHELRTLLTSILRSLRLVNQKHYGQNTTKSKRLFRNGMA